MRNIRRCLNAIKYVFDHTYGGQILRLVILATCLYVIISAMSGCKKETIEGPQGPQGSPGDPGNVTMWHQDITVLPSAWVGPGANDVIFHTFGLTNNIADGDMVVFYFDNSGQWQPLPVTQEGITMRGTFAVTMATIWMDPVPTAPTAITNYRIVVVPGMEGGRISPHKLLELIDNE
jgi:hypothetical protein